MSSLGCEHILLTFTLIKKNLDLNQLVSTNHGPCNTTAFITEKKSANKWTREVETCIFQGSTALYFFLKSLRVCCPCSDARLPPHWSLQPLLFHPLPQKETSLKAKVVCDFLYLKKSKAIPFYFTCPLIFCDIFCSSFQQNS